MEKANDSHSLTQPKMGIFSVFSHKIRSKPSLQLNRLPYTLKTRIFSNLDHEDLVKFLKISRELRHHVLDNGLLPGRIKEIQFYGINPEILDGNLIVEDLRITIRTEPRSTCFEIRDLPERRSHSELKISDFWVFEKLASCQKLAIILTHECFSPSLHINLQNFLPCPRFLDKFSICGPDFGENLRIYANYPERVLPEFAIGINFRQTLEIDELASFLGDNRLKDCAQVELIRSRLEMASVYHLDHFRLQSTSARRLLIVSRLEADFDNFISFLIDNYAAFPGSVVVRLDRFVSPSSFVGIGQNLMNKLEYLEKIEDPKTQKEIRAKFGENPIDSREFSEEITYSRRRVAENQQVCYVYLRSEEKVRFQALFDPFGVP